MNQKNPWAEIEALHGENFVLQEDDSNIALHNKRFTDLITEIETEYRKNSPSKQKQIDIFFEYKRQRQIAESSLIRTNIYPTPFVGDIERAKLVFLQTNPGYSDQDVLEFATPEFKSAQLANLLESNRTAPFAFFPLDPRFKYTGAGLYWLPKLKSIIDLCTLYGKNIQYLAPRCMVLELYAYHSEQWDASFPQSPAHQEYLAKYVKQLKEKEAFFIIMRSEKGWKTFFKKYNIVIHRGQLDQLLNPRNPSFWVQSISRKNNESEDEYRHRQEDNLQTNITRFTRIKDALEL